MKIKKTATVLASILFILGTLNSFGNAPVRGDRDGLDRSDLIGTLNRYFQFDEEQLGQFQRLIRLRESTMDQLGVQLRQIRVDMNDLMMADPADPTAIGEKILEQAAVHDAMKDAQDTFVTEFLAMLSEDQMQSYNVLERAMRLRPVIDAAVKMGLGLGMAHDGGDGGGRGQ